MTTFTDTPRQKPAQSTGFRPVVSAMVGWIADEGRRFRQTQAQVSAYDRGGFRH